METNEFKGGLVFFGENGKAFGFVRNAQNESINLKGERNEAGLVIENGDVSLSLRKVEARTEKSPIARGKLYIADKFISVCGFRAETDEGVKAIGLSIDDTPGAVNCDW